MSLRRSTFPEVLDNLLVSMTGGISSESQPFPPPGASSPPYRHTLQHGPVGSIVSVYGSRNGDSMLFRVDTDFKLLSDKKTIEWQPSAQLPDPGTLFQINYYPASEQANLNDLYTGSVVRTLSETVALEIARLYAQLDAVYKSAFLNTADGSSLENVVSLLGLDRIKGGRSTGEVEFTRAPNSLGIITIPGGTRVMTADGKVVYETTETSTFAAEQTAIRTNVRDLEANAPLPAASLTVLPAPIAGIASVTNPAPTSLTNKDETDDQLRTRARNFLHGSERATLGAIHHAVAAQGVQADVEEDQTRPGYVTVTPHLDTLVPELQQRLLTAIEQSRPAGVKVILAGAKPPARVNMELILTTTTGAIAQDLRTIQRTIKDKLTDFFASRAAKDSASINRVMGLIMGVRGVEDARLQSATLTLPGSAPQDILDMAGGTLKVDGQPTVLGELHIADPNLPTQLNAIITYPDGQTKPDSSAVQSALTAVITYLNGLAGAAPAASFTLGYGKLLSVTPLPGHTAMSLQDFDKAVSSGTPPALPTEATIAPYKVQFVFAQESGLSKILAAAADPSYILAPQERLSLAGVKVEAIHA